MSTTSKSKRINTYLEASKGALTDVADVDYTVIKNEENNLVDSLSQREQSTGKSIELVLDQERDIVDKQPLRLLYQQRKIDIGKLPFWFLQAMGSMDLEELQSFLEANQGKLSANEIAAADLILGVVKKDPVATERFWGIHTKMASSKLVSNQFNTQVNISISQNMKKMLDNIAENALSAGEIVE